MARSQSRLVGMIAMIAVISVCGWYFVVRLNALTPFLCFAPPDQAEMIDAFEDDALYAVAAKLGTLKTARSTSYECDNGKGGSPTTPQFADVTRMYSTSAVYSPAQLAELFNPAAVAGGWTIYGDRSAMREQPPGHVGYCKHLQGRAAYASIRSGEARKSQQAELEVTMDAKGEGDTCPAPR